MAEENQQKSFSEMTEQEQANYIANLSTKPFERMTSEERNVWLQHLDAENDRLTDQEEIAEEEAERLAEEAEERAEREKEEAEERAEREAEEAERRTERESAVKAVNEARAALNTPQARAHQQVVSAQNARVAQVEQLEEQLDKETDEAKRKALEAEINRIEQEIEANEDKFEASTEALNDLNNAYQDAYANLQEIYVEEREAARDARREAAEEKDTSPNFWERYAPSWLGGWSGEEVEAYDKAHPQAQSQEENAPNFWERYAPSWLGGWSGEEVEAYDKAHPQAQSQEENAPKGPQRMSAWERMGKEDHEIGTNLREVDGQREVLKGVTVSELREAGYNDEQIQKMDMMADVARDRASDARRTLGANAQAVLTEEDYQQAGFNQQDMATIYNLSKNQNS